MLSIKHLFALIIITLSLTGCASTEQKIADHIGSITPEQLNSQYVVFGKNYNSYQLSAEQMAAVKALPSDLSIEVFFATWCHDSEREVPRLLKALAGNNVPVTLIALDYHKLDPEGLAEEAGIKFTPTIIVKQNNQELGRIIERPKVDLVTDIVGFLEN